MAAAAGTLKRPRTPSTLGEHAWEVVDLINLEPGDAVVYIKAGHRVHEAQFSKGEASGSLPPGELFFGRVISISSDHLRRAILGAETDGPDAAGAAVQYTIEYEIDAGEPEFLIRRDTYDRSIAHTWSVGELFEQIFDKKWYVGKIVAITADPKVAPWECFDVVWRKVRGRFVFDAEAAKVSPWEIRPTLSSSDDADASASRPSKRPKHQADGGAGGSSGDASSAHADSDSDDGRAARKNSKAARSAAAARMAEDIRRREIDLWREQQLLTQRRKQEEEEARVAAEKRAAAEAAERQRLEDAARAEVEAREREEKERERAEQARLKEERLRRNLEIQAEQQKRNRELLEQRRAAEEERRRQEESTRKKQRYRYAMVCASNMNRSMEAHSVLQKKGFTVSSYGTGSQVKIPGRTIRTPNVYEFGQVTYDDVYNDVKAKNDENDDDYYRRNGILMLLERNRATKLRPQKWQTTDFTNPDNQVDVVVCFEERVYQAVIEDLMARGSQTMTPVMVINLEVVDNSEAATIGGQDALKLITLIENVEDLEDGIEGALDQFSEDSKKPLLMTVAFF